MAERFQARRGYTIPQATISNPSRGAVPDSQGPNAFRELEKAIDACGPIAGAGIVYVRKGGTETEIRGGPRVKYVFIMEPGATSSAVQAENEPEPGVLHAFMEWLAPHYDRWGGAAFSCTSAAATGVAIYLSGGTAGFVVGAFAVNSALLCGTSVGKAWEYDAWKQLEAEGGGIYMAFITAETLLSFADLCNGIHGAATLLKSLEKAEKLNKLLKGLKGRNLSKAQLFKLIQEVDPKAAAGLAKRVKKVQLIAAGKEVLKDKRFLSLTNQQQRELLKAIGDAFTLGGAFGLAGPSMPESVFSTLELYLVDYRAEVAGGAGSSANGGTGYAPEEGGDAVTDEYGP